jgi:tripartite-type tricarboxylate transporter receptor subunit TctC
VSFVVGFSPGGGVDVSSRLMANTMAKYGNCSVVVRNMPGAGGILGLNHVYTADPDGLTVMIAPLGLTEVAQLLKSPGVKYDCRRFNWLGRFNTEPQVLVTGNNSPYKSLDDVRKAKTVFSTGAEPTARASLAILITAEALGMDNLKVIYGYPGSAEQILALIRGEADLYSPSLGTYLRQKKELRPLLVIERKRVADIPDVPALGELSIKQRPCRGVLEHLGHRSFSHHVAGGSPREGEIPERNPGEISAGQGTHCQGRQIGHFPEPPPRGSGGEACQECIGFVS